MCVLLKTTENGVIRFNWKKYIYEHCVVVVALQMHSASNIVYVCDLDVIKSNNNSTSSAQKCEWIYCSFAFDLCTKWSHIFSSNALCAAFATVASLTCWLTTSYLRALRSSKQSTYERKILYIRVVAELNNTRQNIIILNLIQLYKMQEHNIHFDRKKLICVPRYV